MPITLPDEFTKTWFKANMPFKDKQFNKLEEIIDDIAEAVGEINTHGAETGKVSTAIGYTKQLAAEERKLEAAKGLGKDYVKRLVQYGNAAQMLGVSLAKALEEQKTAAELATKSRDEIFQFKIAIDRADKLIEKLYGPVRELMQLCETEADPVKLAVVKKKLETAYAACGTLLEPGGGGWEKRWQGLMRVATPATKKEMDTYGIRVARAIKVRDTLVKGYAVAMAHEGDAAAG